MKAKSIPSKAIQSKIESGKIVVSKLFNEFWFKIPDYQRSYVWGEDQIGELLDDLSFAHENHADKEYFLGSMVLQKKSHSQEREDSIQYIEYDVLDGQQRLTTLLLLIACIRDLAKDAKLIKNCESCIGQEEDRYKGNPGRLRIIYDIRDDVLDFVKDFVVLKDGTAKTSKLKEMAEENNVSIANMSNALLQIREELSNRTSEDLENFSTFLFQKVLMIFVSSEDLEDAFRLFTILNDRGLPLSNSDILKSWNLGEIKNESERERSARFWENAEGYLGRDEFDRLLSYIRTIFVKDKARENILTEFEEKIYGRNLLIKGSATINTIEEYYDIYDLVIWFNSASKILPYQFKNLVTIMWFGYPSTDWIPPLLQYYKIFGKDGLLQFTELLDRKFSCDWITQLTPTDRINNMNEILKAIESVNKYEALLTNKKIFDIDLSGMIQRLKGDIYGRKFGKYILMKLEYLFKDHSSQFADFKQISVEHVLPQNPPSKSQWWNKFTSEQHKEYLNKLGNLVLISRRKNTQLSNADFREKKKRYFSGNIDAFPNSVRVMEKNEWTPAEIDVRQEDLLKQIIKHYKK